MGWYTVTIVSNDNDSEINVDAVGYYPDKDGVASYASVTLTSAAEPDHGSPNDVASSSSSNYSSGSSSDSNSSGGSVSSSSDPTGGLYATPSTTNINPVDFLFFLNGNVAPTDPSDSSNDVNSTLFWTRNNIALTGSVYSYNRLYPLTFKTNVTMTGNFVSNGDLYVSQNDLMPIAPELDVIGNVTLDEGTILASDIFATGNGTFNSRSEINGNVHVNGTLSMNVSDGLNAKIDKNAIAGGNVTLGGQSSIGGSLITGGTCTAPKGLSSYVAGTVMQNEAPSPISITAASSLNTSVPLPDDASTYSTVEITPITYEDGNPDKTITSAEISNSGILDISGYNFYNKNTDDNNTNTNTDNATITVDTSQKDINLIVKSTLELNNLNIEATGSYNLYIYLDYDSTQHFWLNGSSYLGMVDQNAEKSNVFIFRQPICRLERQ